MKKFSIAFLLCYCCFCSTLFSQDATVSVSDITNFWQAYDSVQTTTDRQKKVEFIQKLYVDKGTIGLKEMMELRGGTAEKWAEMIETAKTTLEEKRPYTLSVLQQKAIIEQKLLRLKALYPDFQGGDIFFVVGISNSGGTIKGKHVLIGTEVIANEKENWAVSTVLHEFIHTLQKPCNYHFLAHCIHEGMADFGSELIHDEGTLAERYPNSHTAFGLKNEQAVWDEFKKYMHLSLSQYFGWLYDSRTINGQKVKDLGYFVGYQICKSYYNKATDKKKTLKEIFEWDMSSDENARDVVLKSGYLNAKDEKFVKKMKFSTEIPKSKNIKKVVFGYNKTQDNLVFTYTLDKAQTNIKSVAIAGNFNEWKPNIADYQLQKINDTTFELKFPLSKFEKGKAYQFKFVLNGDNWQEPPANAENVSSEGGYLNLTFNL